MDASGSPKNVATSLSATAAAPKLAGTVPAGSTSEIVFAESAIPLLSVCTRGPV